MGLDTFAARTPDGKLTKEDMGAFEKADIHLYGGVFSGSAPSFRGKLYDGVIHDITGISLYQEWIPPDEVKKMCEALELCDPEEIIKDAKYTNVVTSAAITELRKFFRVCAQRGLGLVGWW